MSAEPWRRAGAAAAMLFALAGAARASEVRIFRQASQPSFLRGQLSGLSVDALGTLRLAPRTEKLTSLVEPFVLSAAVARDGWVLGTGNAGKVLHVGRDGGVHELFATAEPEVFAVAVDDEGTVWAGSSPRGKIYRYRDGKATVWFDPHQTYIWQLLPIVSGGRRHQRVLLAATGTEGKLFRISGEGEGEVFWKGDTHVRSLARLPDGALLVGTDGEGLLVRLTAQGEARTLYDAVEPEIVAITVGDDGTAWMAAVASEASQVSLAGPSEPAREKRKGAKAEQPESAVTASADAAPSLTAGSRPAGFQGARSEILRIDPDGSVQSVARLQDETVHSLLWLAGKLWLGTGQEGKLYSLQGTDLRLESDVEERQIIALLADGDHPAFATTNASAFYRTSGMSDRGTYVSPVLDAQQIARFGTFRWMGLLPAETTMEFSFRSGITAEPDASWSKWTAARQGREIALKGLPSGRYLQWRLVASAPSGFPSPQLAAAEISFLQANLPPRITQLEVMDPGQILVAMTFNPGNQAYEPAHPNREGIFTTLQETPEAGDDRLKTLWKHGYRTLRWKAEDPNRDELTYTLSFRRETVAGPAGAAAAEGGGRDGDGSDGGGSDHGGGAANATGWLPMADRLSDSYYAFDATALPDGIYRFRLVAADDKAQGADTALTDSRVSEPVVIDHTPPRLVGVQRDGDRLLVEVDDAWNPLREAAFSVGGGPWKPAAPVDGLLDSSHEVLIVPLPPNGDHARDLVLLRVMDAAFNGIAFDLSERAK